MSNTLTTATEGLLQEDGGGGCVKVVARENVVNKIEHSVSTQNTVVQQRTVTTTKNNSPDVSVVPVITPILSARTEDHFIVIGEAAQADGDKHYRHVQSVPEAVWLVTHGLDKRPAVTVVDSSGTVVIGDVVYISDNAVTLYFKNAFSGQAYFN